VAAIAGGRLADRVVESFNEIDCRSVRDSQSSSKWAATLHPCGARKVSQRVARRILDGAVDIRRGSPSVGGMFPKRP
jgi:hypothetical protein